MVERLHHHATRVALIAALAVGPTAAQKPASEAKPAKPTWPALSKADAAKGVKWLKLLGSKKAETRDKAAAILVELGPGMAERLFRRLTDSPGRDVNQQVVAVLDKLLKPEHAELIGGQARHQSVFARRYVMQRLARWGSDVSTPVFVQGRQDKDVEVAYYAALGLVKTRRDTAALDAIFARCVEQWGEIGDEVSRFLSPARSDKFIPWITARLKSEEVPELTATLRMMRSLAPASAKTLVRPFLDSDHSILKKEAINTLRVIVDGDQPLPLKKITVFLVIKLAKEWKQRI